MRPYGIDAGPTSPGHLPVIAFVAAVIVIWLANLAGLWWVTFLVGFLLAFLPVRGGRAFGLAALAGLAGWALGLLWLLPQQSVGGTAAVAAAIMGFGRHSAPVLVLVLLLGAILAGVGAWLAIALRAAVLPRFRDPFGQF